MPPEADPVELVACEPDPRLQEEDLAQLPEAVGRPPELPPSPARRRLVAAGATLTGVTLLGGIALIVLGLIDAVAGGPGASVIAALALGVVLVGTHWGWVHVAEASADALQERRNRALMDTRRGWLAAIEPYTRWEVSTSAGEDGSITILTERHRPVLCGSRRFSFRREIVEREVHSGEEPAAAITERAEVLRRWAAAATQAERERYEIARDAYERALLDADDEQQRLAALRAASEALSQRINTNLRDPPLVE